MQFSIGNLSFSPAISTEDDTLALCARTFAHEECVPAFMKQAFEQGESFTFAFFRISSKGYDEGGDVCPFCNGKVKGGTELLVFVEAHRLS